MASRINIQSEITTFDIETIGNEFKLDRIGLVSDLYQEVFLSYAKFFEFIVKKKITQLWSFYGGGFDNLLLLDFIRYNKTYKLVSVIEISGLLMYIKISKSGFEFELIDAYGIFRGSDLNTVSKNLIGKEKLPDIDRVHLEDYSEEKRNEYVLNDCVILRESLIEFKNEIGFLDFTISRIALKNFMEKFCLHKNDIVKLPANFIGDILPFYYGGHVDVYKRYGENLKYYDINSCYGYAMKMFGAIYRFDRFVSKFSDTETKKGLYQIRVHDKMDIPIIPYRFKEKNYEKIYFLNSDKPVLATSIDIELLEQLNIKYTVENGYLFYYDSNFFGDYIDYWYKKRQESKKLKFIAKLMINSLYGKFGQKIKRKSTIVSDKLEDDQYYDKELNLGKKDTITITWFNQPQIAAWVTSGARFFHSMALNKYSNNLYYGDTDSFILDCEINSNEVGIELGKVKLEYENIERGYFLGCKFYGLFNSDKPLYFDNENKPINKSVVLKGFEFKENLTEEHFKNALYKNDFEFEYKKQTIQKFKRSLISFDQYIKYCEVKKNISMVGLKRKLLNDKINTNPYFLTNSNNLI